MASQTHLQVRDWGVGVENIRVKVHLYHSPADEEVPFGAAVRMVALFPEAEVVTLAEEVPPENGHHLHSIDLGLDWVLSRYRKNRMP